MVHVIAALDRLSLVAETAEITGRLSTDTDADAVAALPEVSVAIAVIEWVPFGTVRESQLTPNGAVVCGAPRSAPSS